MPPIHDRSRVRVPAVAAVALALSGCPGSTDKPATTATTSSGAAAGFQAQHKGGTLKLLAKSAAGSLDPQVNYTLQYWQLYQSMYDGLMAFKKIGGQGSVTPPPEPAQGGPQINRRGETELVQP